MRPMISGSRWRGGLAALAVLGVLATCRAAGPALPDDLVGQWTVADETTTLSQDRNPNAFRISRAVAAKTDWSDGSFSFAWEGEPAASRGYYSLETGRVWVTTRRYVNGRLLQVEYRGALREDGGVVWSGTASTPNQSPPISWSFVATRE